MFLGGMQGGGVKERTTAGANAGPSTTLRFAQDDTLLGLIEMVFG
jgi:hypothetical protein